jgi:hypothetical protein
MAAPRWTYLKRYVEAINSVVYHSELTSRNILLHCMFPISLISVNFHPLHPLLLPFQLLPFPFLTQDILQILRSTIHVLGVVRVLERSGGVEV